MHYSIKKLILFEFFSKNIFGFYLKLLSEFFWKDKESYLSRCQSQHPIMFKPFRIISILSEKQSYKMLRIILVGNFKAQGNWATGDFYIDSTAIDWTAEIPQNG